MSVRWEVIILSFFFFFFRWGPQSSPREKKTNLPNRLTSSQPISLSNISNEHYFVAIYNGSGVNGCTWSILRKMNPKFHYDIKSSSQQQLKLWKCKNMHMYERMAAKLTLTPTPPFSFLDYLLGKGGVQKWGFPAWVSNRGPVPNALYTHGTPPGCRCPGSDFVPIWDPLLWRNRT